MISFGHFLAASLALDPSSRLCPSPSRGRIALYICLFYFNSFHASACEFKTLRIFCVATIVVGWRSRPRLRLFTGL